MSRKLWLLAGVAALIPAVPVLAQDAAAAGAADEGLEDIIVIAQRRVQVASDVPISITVADAETLATNRVDNVANIQNISPSISFRVTNIASSSAQLIIRLCCKNREA